MWPHTGHEVDLKRNWGAGEETRAVSRSRAFPSRRAAFDNVPPPRVHPRRTYLAGECGLGATVVGGGPSRGVFERSPERCASATQCMSILSNSFDKISKTIRLKTSSSIIPIFVSCCLSVILSSIVSHDSPVPPSQGCGFREEAASRNCARTTVEDSQWEGRGKVAGS